MNVYINGKSAGEIQGTTLLKRGKQVILFRNFDGFGIAEKILKDYPIEKIVIVYNNISYETTSERFLEKGIKYHKPPFEPQIILPRSYFQVIDKKQISLC